ncbi:unnamed protein product [Rangifer tarandus platyrhynchus]|uniref:Uncharacterized protein n=3 Tax=Rangifer tarandus platyrhynchus TaxID=3082113 RepID=A0ABN8XYK6_RANTA|nr:unnamed protein product [Rangifer tarandus platyrhynchus]CAI9713325.1 unnamed protein product [Rangifer tarandus platyrhynchus]
MVRARRRQDSRGAGGSSARLCALHARPCPRARQPLPFNWGRGPLFSPPASSGANQRARSSSTRSGGRATRRPKGARDSGVARSRRLGDWHRWNGPVQATRNLRVAQGWGDSSGVGQSPKRAASRVRPSEVGFRSSCAASCIFIRSGHFVCWLTSDAKSRAPIKAQRNKGAACLDAGPPGAVPPSPL